MESILWFQVLDHQYYLVCDRMDNKAQAAAEFILIIGGIIVIVMVLLIAYKNYLSDLSGEINSTEVQNLDNAINGMMEYFK